MLARLYEAIESAESMKGQEKAEDVAKSLGEDAQTVLDLETPFKRRCLHFLDEDFNTSGVLGLAFELAFAQSIALQATRRAANMLWWTSGCHKHLEGLRPTWPFMPRSSTQHCAMSLSSKQGESNQKFSVVWDWMRIDRRETRRVKKRRKQGLGDI